MVHDMLLETRSLTKEFRGFRAVPTWTSSCATAPSTLWSGQRRR
jgi:hypothetical protein